MASEPLKFMTCMKCQKLQPKTDVCIQCGSIVLKTISNDTETLGRKSHNITKNADCNNATGKRKPLLGFLYGIIKGISGIAVASAFLFIVDSTETESLIVVAGGTWLISFLMLIIWSYKGATSYMQGYCHECGTKLSGVRTGKNPVVVVSCFRCGETNVFKL